MPLPCLPLLALDQLQLSLLETPILDVVAVDIATDRQKQVFGKEGVADMPRDRELNSRCVRWAWVG